MSERPLLLFPKPGPADRTKRKQGGFPGLHKLSHEQQVQKFDPIIQKIRSEFEARRAEIQNTPYGIEPEQVLVFETIGSVQNFITAVKRVEGLEWMAEIDADEIELDRRLYLVMSNQKALNDILSLWGKYKSNKEGDFKPGQTGFRDVFSCLKDIRWWGVSDRLDETGLIDAWEKDLKYRGKKKVCCEIELWFGRSDAKRKEAHENLRILINNLGGKILADSVIEDIEYHALLAEIPAEKAQQIINYPDTELVKCDKVMFFYPTGQMVVGKGAEEGALSDHEVTDTAAPTGDPVVAILDGLPLENHEFIVPWINVDDPDNYAAKYPTENRRHGTAMASLVVRGDLNDNASGLTHPVYMRPIMKSFQTLDNTGIEGVPDDILLIDYVHRAVRRIFEGEGNQDAVAPTIRIINFSIGDPCRQFARSMSPLAKLLDWLSAKYQVLFIISAGNHDRDIKTNVLKDDFNKFSVEEKENKIVEVLYGDARNRRLLSPGESMNGITVGSLHHDASEMEFMGSFVKNLFGRKLPSPISPFGNGYRRSIKPDILFSGGRVLYKTSLKSNPNMIFELQNNTIRAPGHKVASPSKQPGELKKAVYCCGTSNAAALTSRAAAMCHDVLLEIFEEKAAESGFDDGLRRSCIAPLIKSMIVHGCSWGETGANLQDIIKTLKKTKQETKKQIMRWLGYGVPEYERVLACTAQRVTLLGYGKLSDGQAHIFNLPLPPSMDMRREKRRLTTTLTWMSPIAPNRHLYRSTRLWFEIDKDKDKNNKVFESGAVEVDNYSSHRGTVQHQIFESKKAVEMTDKNISLKVNCRKDATEIQEPVPYGLAVTFEIAEGSNIDIYEEIRKQITPTVEIDPAQNT